ncbi:MAG: HD family phosphohydrolase, partial [bacterium]
NAKVWEFTYDRSVEYTDRGQLLGHLVMEVEFVHEKIKTIPGFPEDLGTLVEHLMVSHHGALEFGSPKLPQTLEALILHYLDDLDGKINSIQALMEKDPASPWTTFHRAYGRSFYKGKPNEDNKSE